MVLCHIAPAEATRPEKRIVTVDHFFRGVAGIDHAFARTAQRGFDFAHPFLHAVGGYGVAAVVLPIESEQFIRVGRGKAQEIRYLPVHVAAIGEMVRAPPTIPASLTAS